MTDDKRSEGPRERFRNILSADKDEPRRPEMRKPPVVNLPGAGGAPPQGRQSDIEGGIAGGSVDRGSPSAYRLYAFWTIGALLSVTANVLLAGLVLGVWGRGYARGLDSGALTEIYRSLDQVDHSSLRVTVPVQAALPLETTVPVETSTRITLTNDVLVRGAYVSLNAGGVSIDAPAEVTLPAGTELDVRLDMMMPLKTVLPLTADVPVDISIAGTELHQAIQSIQASLRASICAESPTAALDDGTPICR